MSQTVISTRGESAFPAGRPVRTRVSGTVHGLLSDVAWCLGINAAWIVGVLAGGVVLGVAPATVAAATLVRRRDQGRAVRVASEFAQVWRAEIWRSQGVVLPPLAVVLVLWSNYTAFSALGAGAAAMRVATLVAFVLAVAVASYATPLAVHYEIRRRSLPLVALRLVIGRPLHTFLILLVWVVLAVASSVVPLLLLLVSIGAGLHVTTWLALRVFDENEEKLLDPDDGAPVRSMPVEPLRMD